jgi:hypothetical protein
MLTIIISLESQYLDAAVGVWRDLDRRRQAFAAAAHLREAWLTVLVSDPPGDSLSDGRREIPHADSLGIQTDQKNSVSGDTIEGQQRLHSGKKLTRRKMSAEVRRRHEADLNADKTDHAINTKKVSLGCSAPNDVHIIRGGSRENRDGQGT